VLYKIIAKHKNPRDLYADKLIDGIIDAGHVKVLKRNTKLEMNLEASRKKDLTIITPL
jgi:2-oxoglutarate dehydrogenase E1 component